MFKADQAKARYEANQKKIKEEHENTVAKIITEISATIEEKCDTEQSCVCFVHGRSFESLTAILREAGYEVQAVHDGEEEDDFISISWQN
jgi:bisphosphoglycerate-dependent phosphoglycerate mutase